MIDEKTWKLFLKLKYINGSSFSSVQLKEYKEYDKEKLEKLIEKLYVIKLSLLKDYERYITEKGIDKRRLKKILSFLEIWAESLSLIDNKKYSIRLNRLNTLVENYKNELKIIRKGEERIMIDEKTWELFLKLEKINGSINSKSYLKKIKEWDKEKLEHLIEAKYIISLFQLKYYEEERIVELLKKNNKKELNDFIKDLERDINNLNIVDDKKYNRRLKRLNKLLETINEAIKKIKEKKAFKKDLKNNDEYVLK
ncbi:conserved hypothetical protein [Treponema primitia ZAS-2]|uniref:Uncharacterized protein n=1 Tax=Treponema primitia (strain ATCC BAA-887 / DSM 12427 / ZAS-2) TaxID=545694 RepID=F5YGJ4_TREPZ|nr:hypothetical protein [Treponema primitia]AEF84693.1 conserved hypothetical protein [Treponema primitia ZAS-2]